MTFLIIPITKHERFAYISEDIHKLVRIARNQDWTQYAWRIKEDKDLYWVPVPNENNNFVKFRKFKLKRVKKTYTYAML